MGPGSKELEDLIKHFEKCTGHKNLDRTKDEAFIRQGYVFNNGERNRDFQFFRMGYAFGKFIESQREGE